MSIASQRLDTGAQCTTLTFLVLLLNAVSYLLVVNHIVSISKNSFVISIFYLLYFINSIYMYSEWRISAFTEPTFLLKSVPKFDTVSASSFSS